MIRLWNRWVGVLRIREGGESLAVFRIACGCCVLLTVGTLLSNDLIGAIWLDAAHGGYRGSLNANWLIRLLGGVLPASVWTVVCVTIVFGCALTLGVWGRVSALICGQGVIALTGLNSHASGSYDLMLTNALWLLVLCRSDATLSLSCRFKHGNWMSPVQVPMWPRYLVVFQLAAVYASTGMQKLSVYWTPAGDFSALYYILQQPSWQRFDVDWVAYVFPLTQIATAVTWVWELTAPLLLLAMYFQATSNRSGWLRRTFNRVHYVWVFVIIGLVMHLATWILMDVGPFTWVTLAYYPCILRPNWWRNLATKSIQSKNQNFG